MEPVNSQVVSYMNLITKTTEQPIVLAEFRTDTGYKHMHMTFNPSDDRKVKYMIQVNDKQYISDNLSNALQIYNWTDV